MNLKYRNEHLKGHKYKEDSLPRITHAREE